MEMLGATGESALLSPPTKSSPFLVADAGSIADLVLAQFDGKSVLIRKSSFGKKA
jgi:hypothetical protein